MLTSIVQSAAAGWLWRRVQELASLAGIFIPIYLAMPPGMQRDVQAIFTGQGGGLTISAAMGLAWYLWTQFQSYRATTKAQVVTSGGQKIAIAPNSRSASRIEAEASVATKPRTLWERLFAK